MPTDRASIAQAAAEGIRQFRDRGASAQALIGFDGFVDSIAQVVARRHSFSSYDAVPTIEALGQSIAQAAGQSTNYELVTTRRKLGGNGPIMANALATAGVGVTYVGALGLPTPHEVFADFAEMAEVYSIAEPGYTDALEFHDGKLMLGKHNSLVTLAMDDIDRALGRDAFAGLVGRSRLIAMVNWTMLMRMETIWTAMLEQILPAAPATPPGEPGQPRLIFVDLADPAKRSDLDIRHAMEYMRQMSQYAGVVLGLNLSEARRVAQVLGVPEPEDDDDKLIAGAEAIRDQLQLHSVVVHPRRGAAGARINDAGGVDSGFFAGPFIQHPKLSTGAGDNFNAGYCLGLLANLPIAQALCVGVGVSGFYVREARSPRAGELANFCESMPESE